MPPSAPPSADAAPPLSKAATHVRQSVFAALQGRIDAHRHKGGTLIPLQIGDTHLAPPGPALAAVSYTHLTLPTIYSV